MCRGPDRGGLHGQFGLVAGDQVGKHIVELLLT